jgi:hypothetical protein
MDRGFGRQVAGRSESLKAVGREFVGPDIVTDVAGLSGLDQHVPDQVGELPLRAGDMPPSMQECGELGAAGVEPTEPLTRLLHAGQNG